MTGVGDSVNMLEGGVGWCPLERRRGRRKREARVESGQPTRVQRSVEEMGFSVLGRWIPRLQFGCNSREGYQALRTPIPEHKVVPW